jgi:RNA polymerase sigma factor (sigma-70 family)
MDDVARLAGTWNAAGQAMSETLTFDVFFHDECDRLLRVLCVVTGSRSQAEDIAQEAFTRVFERWDLVATMGNPAGYLYRTAMNQFRSDYRRAARALKRVVTLHAEADDVFAPVDDRDEAARALSALTPRQRAALVLTEALGYSGEETGELLGIEASTVYALTHQARAALADTMEANR